MLIANNDVLDQPLRFEELPTHGLNGTPLHRAKIPGGWLVACNNTHALCFVPDRYHLWSGSNDDEL